MRDNWDKEIINLLLFKAASIRACYSRSLFSMSVFIKQWNENTIDRQLTKKSL